MRKLPVNGGVPAHPKLPKRRWICVFGYGSDLHIMDFVVRFGRIAHTGYDIIYTYVNRRGAKESV